MRYKEKIDDILNLYQFELIDNPTMREMESKIKEIIPFPCAVMIKLNEDETGIYLDMHFPTPEDATAFKLMY